MRLPLQVQLSDASGAFVRDVSALVSDLQFRSTSPLGFASASITFDRSSGVAPRYLTRWGELRIIDARNTCTVWEGKTEDPAQALGGDAAHRWSVAALGPGVHAKDTTRPLIYADRRLTPWQPGKNNHPAIQISQGDETVATITMQVPRGTATTTSTAGEVAYTDVYDAGMKLARIALDWDTGVTDAAWVVNIQTRTGLAGAPAGYAASAGANTAGGSLAATAGGANFSLGNNVVALRFDRDTSALTIANDDTWAVFRNVAVRTILMNTQRAEITTGYTGNTVLASEVFTDAVARLCPRFDLANATITPTTYAINQLANPEGISPFDLFEALMVFEPTFTWHVWEKNPTNGLYKIEWVQWPTTKVRYEAHNTDGFNPNASAVELYNAVTVAYRDSDGKQKTVRLTQSVAELTAAGITREGYIDLGEQGGSSANAAQVGTTFLSEHATPPNRGTLTVKRPIRDLITGRTIQPWEIRPGSLIRVHGIVPNVDALNPVGRNSQTIFQVVATNYNSSDNACTLELDSFARTTAKLLADSATTIQRRLPGVPRR